MDLKDKAIKIKGKDYVLVSDRVKFFNEKYPEGAIHTELVSEPNSQYIVVKATIYPDKERFFTGYSQATIGEGMVNKTAALENAETSAVGRALAFMGIGVLDSIASVDEMKKAGIQDTPREIPKVFSGMICSACGASAAVSYRKDPNGKPYCPNWKTHKAKGEKTSIVSKEDKADTDKFFEGIETIERK